jgi:hypothetical protein
LAKPKKSIDTMSYEDNTTAPRETNPSPEAPIHPNALAFFQGSMGSDPRLDALSAPEANNLFLRAATICLVLVPEQSPKQIIVSNNLSLVSRFINGETFEEISVARNLDAWEIIAAKQEITKTLIGVGQSCSNRLLETIIEQWETDDPETVPVSFRKQTEQREDIVEEKKTKEISDTRGRLVLWAVANPREVDLSKGNCALIDVVANGAYGTPSDQREFAELYCANCAIRNICLGRAIGSNMTRGVFGGIPDRPRRALTKKLSPIYASARKVYKDTRRPDAE